MKPAICIFVLTCLASLFGQPPASVWDGVYSEEQAGRGKSNRDVSTLHVIPPTSDLGAYPTSAIRIGRSDRSNRP